ncbi:MAG: phage protease [Myxococcota bacterium]
MAVRRRLRSVMARLAMPVALLSEAPAPGTESETAPIEIPERKWIHVASEGAYKGHVDGDFVLNRKVFEEFVAGLHEDPRFQAGADGFGENPVLPFDYEHVSEMDPREGAVPEVGAPAPAWVLDLKVVDGNDGKAQLWCYALLGERIREQMAKNEYRFVSIAFVLESVDPVTAEKAGPRLTSIAFTNHPFLRDLAPLAASNRGLRNWYGDPASSPEEGFEFTRAILQLPAVSTNEDVLTELAKVVAWAKAPDTAPAGVDIAEIMNDLRRAWGVAVTSTADDLLDMARKAAANLIQPAAPPETPAPVPPTPPSETQETSGLSASEPNIMSDQLQKKIVALFNAKRGVKLLDSEEAIAAAIDQALSDSLDLGAVLKALGYESASQALQGIPDLLAAKKKLGDALAQLEEAMTMQEQIDSAAEASDVGAAMSAKGYGDDEQLRTALRSHRSSVISDELKKLPEGAGPKQLAECRKTARRAFLASYGVPPEGQESLLTNIVAGPGGAQLAPPRSLTSGSNTRQLSIRESAAGSGARTVQLAGLEGRNRTERLLSWIRANEPNGDKMSWRQLNARADQLKSDRNVVIEDAN